MRRARIPRCLVVCTQGLIPERRRGRDHRGRSPHEGKVISVDKDAMALSVRGREERPVGAHLDADHQTQGATYLATRKVKVGDKGPLRLREKGRQGVAHGLKRTEKAKG
jgi:hypothetical protein